jgi:hypothetical protein
MGLILGALAQVNALIADGGCDSNRFRQTLADRSQNGLSFEV